jgi:predicted O-methyltransferase YrrM
MLSESSARAWIESICPVEPTAARNIRARVVERGFQHEEVFPFQLAFLRTLVWATAARDVLELGTFLGYSTAGIAEALKRSGDGRMVTVERAAERSRTAHDSLQEAGLAGVVDFVVGDAHEVCSSLVAAKRRFDLVFLDTAESQYPILYPICVQLLRRRGVLAVDNVLMPTVDGWTTGKNVVQAPEAEPIASLCALLEMASGDHDVLASVLPVGSGMLLCSKA